MDQPPVKTATGQSMVRCARSAFMVACVLSLSVGFLDLGTAVLTQPSRFPSFGSMLPPLATIVCVLFVMYMVVWVCITFPMQRLLKLAPFPLSLSLAFFFVGLLFVTVLLHPVEFTYSARALVNSLITLVLCLSVSTAAYHTGHVVVHMPRLRNVAFILCIAAPFVLAGGVLLLWLQVCGVNPSLPGQSILLGLGCVLSVLLVLGVLFRVRKTPGSAWLLGVFLVAVVASPFAGWMGGASPRIAQAQYQGKNFPIRNVILITVDTLRADVLSCYSQQAPPTPCFQRFAEDGILFEQAYSAAPWTFPAIASVMTGLPPWVHEASQAGATLPQALPTLAECLRDAGYHTAAIGRSLVLQPTRRGISQGFLEYNFYPKNLAVHSMGDNLLVRVFPVRSRREASTESLTDLCIDWLDANANKPFFLWVHYFDPHTPYAPPTAYLPDGEPPPTVGTRFAEDVGVRSGYFVPSKTERNWIRQLYEAEVRYVDDNLGRLLAALKKQGLYDQSLIILSSDHGEEMWERGVVGHGHTLYQELLRVPLVVKPPGSHTPRRIETPVSTQRIMWTVLDLCEVGYVGDEWFDDSLAGLWQGDGEPAQAAAVLSTGTVFYEQRECVFFDGLKYIRSLVTEEDKLYDLSSDPQERASIAAWSADKVQQARRILQEYNDRARELRERFGVLDSQQEDLDWETLQQLKALGYIQ